MTEENDLKKILKGVEQGGITVAHALTLIRNRGIENLDFARIDHARHTRCGIPEVIYAESKSVEQIFAIAKQILKQKLPLLITRIDENKYAQLRRRLSNLKYNSAAKAAFLSTAIGRKIGGILIATAGTSDIPVAEEAAVTCDAMGFAPERLYDVGVAGIHRLISSAKSLERAKVIIVAAGMEGALPSVVGGLVDKPVIAVPTSVGYGASFQGIAALLSMLNSCASGVTVVNIDNGFGAAAAAIRIMNTLAKKP